MLSDRRIARADVEGLEGFDRLQRLHEAAVGALEDGTLDELTPGMRALTTLFVVCGDIENGGFEASMYNSSGDWIGEAIRGARLIGADGHADLLEEFLRFGMAGDPAMSGDAREARLEAMTDEEAEQLERLGDAFFDLPSLDDALTSYVERHGDEFFTN